MHFGIECLFSSHVYMKFTECQLEVWNQGSTQKLQVFLTLHQVALASKIWKFVRKGMRFLVRSLNASGIIGNRICMPIPQLTHSSVRLQWQGTLVNNSWGLDETALLRTDFTCSDVLCRVWCYNTLGTCKPPVLALAVNSRWTLLWHYLWVQHPAGKKTNREINLCTLWLLRTTGWLKTMGGAERKRNKFP